MTDVLTVTQRRLNMSRIRGKNTKPEMLIRRGLHARGLRFRLHDKELPGCPDLVFSRYRTAVFVHGCFWHAHGCALSKLPATREDFWRQKLQANATRDRNAVNDLHKAGWRVLMIWECALRGPGRLTQEAVLQSATEFIQQQFPSYLEIAGTLETIRCSAKPWTEDLPAKSKSGTNSVNPTFTTEN